MRKMRLKYRTFLFSFRADGECSVCQWDTSSKYEGEADARVQRRRLAREGYVEFFALRFPEPWPSVDQVLLMLEALDEGNGVRIPVT
jgi:hypothetical protein